MSVFCNVILKTYNYASASALQSFTTNFIFIITVIRETDATQFLDFELAQALDDEDFLGDDSDDDEDDGDFFDDLDDSDDTGILFSHHHSSVEEESDEAEGIFISLSFLKALIFSV